MLAKLQNVGPFLSLILFILVAALSFGYLNLYQKVNSISDQVTELSGSKLTGQPFTSPPGTVSGLTSQEVQALIDKSLANIPKASNAPTASPTSRPVAKATTTPTVKNTSFIPLGQSYTTNSLDWTDVTGAETYIDLTNDFNSNAEVYFEASLSVDDGTSEVDARLFDVTHSIAVNFSDISSKGRSGFYFTSSPRVYLWQGKNLYRIQIKSPNGTNATIENAKIKVVY